MEEKKSLSKGGFYYLIYNVLNLVFPFINGIYVARILLPESIGFVAAAQNLATYFVILAFLGIPTYGLREIAKTRNDKDERNKIFSELYIINFCSTLIFLSIYLVLIFFIPAYRVNIDIYLVTGLSIALNIFNISWLYEGMEEYKFISIRNLIFKIAVFLLLLIFVRSKEDTLIYAFITVVGTAGNYIVNMLYAPRYAYFTIHGLNLKRHMKPIIYLVTVNLAIELYSLMDITMMNFICGKESIAFYRYGHQIEKILLQIVNTFTMVLIPRIAFYYKENQLVEFNHLITKALKLIIIVAVPMIVGIYFTADFLIVMMYGEQYIISAIILKLFSALLLISPIGYLLGSRVLLVTGHECLMIVSVGIGALVNLVGNILLIPMYAEYGATLASLMSEMIVMVVYVNLGKKYLCLEKISQTFSKVLISVIIMGIYLFLCSYLPINPWFTLIFQMIGAVGIYFILLIFLKEQVILDYLRIITDKAKL